MFFSEADRIAAEAKIMNATQKYAAGIESKIAEYAKQVGKPPEEAAAGLICWNCTHAQIFQRMGDVLPQSLLKKCIKEANEHGLPIAFFCFPDDDGGFKCDSVKAELELEDGE